MPGEQVFDVSAFTSDPTGGNPAAVMPLAAWPDDADMQRAAAAIGYSETAFVVDSDGQRHIRWFTPQAEVPLCGHATLAAAAVLDQLNQELSWPITLQSRSGPLQVDRADGLYTLDFPVDEAAAASAPAGLDEALGCATSSYFKANNFSMVVIDSSEELVSLTPDFRRLSAIEDYGVIVTAPGDSVDFVSRMFAPSLGIDEDPVTGSAHCVLTPYWQQRLGKQPLSAKQLSARGGDLTCEQRGERVLISGEAVVIGLLDSTGNNEGNPNAN